MSQKNPTPVVSSREPVGHARAAIEGVAILTPIATILSWLVTLLPIQVPAQVQAAFAALVVAVGTLMFSEFRNRQYHLALLEQSGVVFVLPWVLAVALLTGCITWDGDLYKRTAGDEIVVIRATPPELPLNPERCKALQDGAVALRNEEGGSRSLNAPFLAGQHIARLASKHDRMGSLCYELVDLDALGEVGPELRIRNRAAWVRAWSNGRALQGGPEEEE